MLPSRISPLDERTNGSSAYNILCPRPVHPPVLHEKSRSIRRMDSYRRIIVNSDNDSLPGPDGIYNASPVGSDEDLTDSKSPMLDCKSFDMPSAESVNALTPVLSPQTQPIGISRSLTLPLSPKSPPLGHSQWPAPHLDTIIEHHDSIRSLRRAISAPRLQRSPERSPKIVKVHGSFHSIRPIRSHRQPWPRPNSLPSTGLHHQRSFSLNDLDCLHHLMNVGTVATRTPGSCTSAEALNAVSDGPSYPARPIEPPPQRVPTPPGLPSFSTREAQVIRLVPDRGGRRRQSIFPSWLVHSPDESDERVVELSNTTASPNVSPENQLSSPSEGLLKRLLAASGMSRLVSPPLQGHGDEPRSSLPSGVVVSSEPSIFAMAEDGTAVRGRFGNRTSGHGIGRRDLNSHPLARIDRAATIDEAVREIDKACSEMNREANASHLQRLPGIPYVSLDAELHRRLSEVGRRNSIRNDISSTSHPEFLSPASSRFALPSPAYPYQSLIHPPDARLSVPNSLIPPANLPTNFASAVVSRMSEPSNYANNATNQISELNSREFQGQQIREQRRLDIEHDHDLGACKQGCALFCLDECHFDLCERKHRLKHGSGGSDREGVLSNCMIESSQVRREAPQNDRTQLVHSQSEVDRESQHASDAAVAAKSALDASATATVAVQSAACTTSVVAPVVCAQIDGQSSPRIQPMMQEPARYPPQLDGQGGSKEQGPLLEWRPQDHPPRLSDWMNYMKSRPDPVYIGPLTPRTQAILDRRDLDRAQGFNPYEAEWTRIRRKWKQDIQTDPNASSTQKSDWLCCLSCCNYSSREHKTIDKAMAPEFRVTKPCYGQYGATYAKAWQPRRGQEGRGNPKVPFMDPVSTERPTESTEMQQLATPAPRQLDGASTAISPTEGEETQTQPSNSPPAQTVLERKAMDEAAGQNPYHAEKQRIRAQMEQEVRDDPDMTKRRKCLDLCCLEFFDYSRKEKVYLKSKIPAEMVETRFSKGSNPASTGFFAAMGAIAASAGAAGGAAGGGGGGGGGC